MNQNNITSIGMGLGMVVIILLVGSLVLTEISNDMNMQEDENEYIENYVDDDDYMDVTYGSPIKENDLSKNPTTVEYYEEVNTDAVELFDPEKITSVLPIVMIAVIGSVIISLFNVFRRMN